nr:inner centromere protein-like [Quercus suber]
MCAYFDWKAIQAIFRLKDEANTQNKAFDLEREKRLHAARTLKVSKTNLSKAREELKKMTRARDAAETSLANAQKRAEDEIRHLRDVEDQLRISKEQIVKLKKKMAKVERAKNVTEQAREEALRAKEEAELAKTEAETSKEKAKKAAYNLGVVETQALLKSQVPEVYRRYCSQTWNEALKQAGVEASSDLWKAKHMYYPLAILEAALPSSKAEVVPEEVGTTPNEVTLTTTTYDAPAKGVEPTGATGTDKD